MWSFFLVFIGGGLGSISRFALGLCLQPWASRFPLATLAANAIACFIIGVLTGLSSSGALPNPYRLLLATGFCGGLSTFSTFTAETWQLLQSEQWLFAATNLILSLCLCMGCLLLGLKFAH
ncbi:MAG: fluoride efflux transporter CrcB [Bacteroidetes bacterium]|nr:fluoride efflux transporter CrcB [Bacteroidota bacterium]